MSGDVVGKLAKGSFFSRLFGQGRQPLPGPGGFGEAKPTKNDGMVGKPVETPRGPPDFGRAGRVVFSAAANTSSS